jgi:hypothetical protein
VRVIAQGTHFSTGNESHQGQSESNATSQSHQVESHPLIRGPIIRDRILSTILKAGLGLLPIPTLFPAIPFKQTPNIGTKSPGHRFYLSKDVDS